VNEEAFSHTRPTLFCGFAIVVCTHRQSKDNFLPQTRQLGDVRTRRAPFNSEVPDNLSLSANHIATTSSLLFTVLSDKNTQTLAHKALAFCFGELIPTCTDNRA
jgi:hypothetical protein